MFDVTLLRPTSSAITRGNPVVVPQLLKLTPISYSATDRGGYDRATIEVSGPASSVAEALSWLRYGVEIVNPYGSTVWAGYVHGVDVVFGGIRYSMTLDRMANKVSVLYSYTDVSGANIAGQTDAATNDESIARYGTKELVAPLSDAEPTAAEAHRDALLDVLSKPLASGDPTTDGPSAKLYCRGWWHTLGWTKYTNQVGREEHVAQDIVHPLKVGFSSTDVGFTRGKTIQDMGGRFADFPADIQMTVSGSTSNNGTFTIEEAAENDGIESYTSNTISFEPNDDVLDSDGALDFLRKGNIIEVTGSSNNSGFHVVDSEGTRHITLYNEFSGSNIVNEAAGSNITIEEGTKLRVLEVTTNEDPGDSVTVTLKGEHLAQKFALADSEAWSAKRIGLYVARVGSPISAATVAIYTDSSGAPGTGIASASITVSEVTTAFDWHWFEFSSPVTLSPSTDYWIHISTAAGRSHEDFFSFGVDSEQGYARGALYTWDGSYALRTPAADLTFKLHDGVDTVAQIADIASGVGAVATVRYDSLSGITTNQYRSGENTAMEEVVQLLDIGNSSGKRLVATMTPDRVLRVYPEPSKASPDYMWSSTGQLRRSNGRLIEDGQLVVGQWATLEEVPPSVDALAEFSPRYITACEYDVDSGQLSPLFGDRNPYDLGIESA